MADATLRGLMPAGIFPPFAAYAHGVEVPAGWRVVLASGQLGISSGGDIPEGVEEQAGLCFANVDAILAEAGMTARDVVRINAYVTDRSCLAGYMAARDAWIGETDAPPASTLMIVVGFARPEFKVEVEVTAAARGL